MIITLLMLALFGLPSVALSQVTCSRLANSLVCSGPDGRRSTITELSPGQGIIRDGDGTVTPYTILPPPSSKLYRGQRPVPIVPWTIPSETRRERHESNDDNGMSIKERY